MANMGRGKSRDTGFDHDGFLGPIGRGVGNIVRNVGDHASRSLSQLEQGWKQAGHIATGGSLGGRCIESSRFKFSIRIPVVGREQGGVNQIPCPTTRAARCGGCILNCAGQEGFSFEKAGSALDLALGISDNDAEAPAPEAV